MTLRKYLCATVSQRLRCLAPMTSKQRGLYELS